MKYDELGIMTLAWLSTLSYLLSDRHLNEMLRCKLKARDSELKCYVKIMLCEGIYQVSFNI